MIPDSSDAAICSTAFQANWKRLLADAITDPETLLRRLALPINDDILDKAQQATRQFGLRVPQGFVDRMRPGDINDPLLLQVLPLANELEQVKGYTGDPVGDLNAMTQPGLLHKYQGRVLLISTGACAIHCRYCFRREFPYQHANPKQDQWHAVLKHIAADDTIEEIILSGGDPLLLTNTALANLIHACEKIRHVQRLRIHSRLPVVLPERIDNELCQLFTSTRLQVIQVIHCNHAQEIAHNVAAAIDGLKKCSELVLNQAVLLKRINDTLHDQVNLHKTLVRCGVTPYYLHMLDRVRGAHHFAVPLNNAVKLHNDLRNALPGYMVPKLVKEIPGQAAKTPISDLRTERSTTVSESKVSFQHFDRSEALAEDAKN